MAERVIIIHPSHRGEGSAFANTPTIPEPVDRRPNFVAKEVTVGTTVYLSAMNMLQGEVVEVVPWGTSVRFKVKWKDEETSDWLLRSDVRFEK
jgi:hypothetical protein